MCAIIFHHEWKYVGTISIVVGPFILKIIIFVLARFSFVILEKSKHFQTNTPF